MFSPFDTGDEWGGGWGLGVVKKSTTVDLCCHFFAATAKIGVHPSLRMVDAHFHIPPDASVHSRSVSRIDWMMQMSFHLGRKRCED